MRYFGGWLFNAINALFGVAFWRYGSWYFLYTTRFGYLLLIHFLGVSGSSIGWTLGSLLPISPWSRWHDNLSNALWNRLFLSPFWSKFYSDIGNTNLVLIFRWLELCFSVWWGFLSRLWPGGGKLSSFLAKSIDMINMHYQCIFIIRRYFSQMSKNITL